MRVLRLGCAIRQSTPNAVYYLSHRHISQRELLACLSPSSHQRLALETFAQSATPMPSAFTSPAHQNMDLWGRSRSPQMLSIQLVYMYTTSFSVTGGFSAI